MKFNFKIQQYQTDAVEAVCNVFAGQGFNSGVGYRRDLGKQKSQANAQLSLNLVDEFGAKFVRKFGFDELNKVAKMNFKNVDKIKELI